MADDDLRVSDAERDQAARLLRDHCAAGRLTIDELDARSETVYAAKTRKELGRTTIDLPPDERSSPPPQQRRRVSYLALPRSTRSDTYTARVRRLRRGLTGRVWWRKKARALKSHWREWYLPSGMDGQCRRTTFVYRGHGWKLMFHVRFRSEGV